MIGTRRERCRFPHLMIAAPDMPGITWRLRTFGVPRIVINDLRTAALDYVDYQKLLTRMQITCICLVEHFCLKADSRLQAPAPPPARAPPNSLPIVRNVIDLQARRRHVFLVAARRAGGWLVSRRRQPTSHFPRRPNLSQKP
jgi:hypothetical protein